EMDKADAGFGRDVYHFMWGPSEFNATGPLKDFDRTSRLNQIRVPVLFTAGRYDECTPSAAQSYQSRVPNSKLVIFERSAHMTMLEERNDYVNEVRKFLREVEAHPTIGTK